ncbi:MAG TPA: hypothetical protein VN652_08400 [Geobacteraceae bacterium]|nr:hypothetical protein [Geobacteraceae bacterium]
MGNELVGLTELMKKLNSDVSFRPDDGTFRSKLAEITIADADAEFVELFSEGSSDILVSISGRTADEGIIRFLVSSDQGESPLECPLALLNNEEIGDLGKQLSRIVAEQLPSVALASRKVVVRKKLVTGMLDISQAAQGLGCSESLLKSRIPCSDYSYDEVDGKTEIKGYYWSQQLIDRLCQVKSNGAKPEDVEYVAGECCHGDSKWAEEIVAFLAPSKPKSRADGASPDGKLPAKIVAKVQRNNRRRPQKKKP